MEMLAKQFQEALKKGLIVVDRKGKLKETPLIPEFKEMIDKETKRFVEFNIPEKLITLNEYINAERTDRYKAANIKKKMTNICAKYAESIIGLTEPKRMYDIECFWTTANNKTDTDNTVFSVKFIMDGLTKTGIIKTDGRKNVRHIHHYIQTIKDINNVKIKLIQV